MKWNHLAVDRLQQTDYRLSSMKALDRSHNVERPAINFWGCLFLCLSSVTQDHVGKNLSAQEIRDMYLDLVEQNRHNRYRGMRDTCFVANHEDVLASAFSYLGEAKTGWYLFKEVDGKKAYTNAAAQKKTANARIEQWSVSGGAFSHFVHTDMDGTIVYNSYPGLRLDRLLSVRGYYLE